MTAKLIDGKKIADEVLSQLKTKITMYLESGKRKPSLAVILVGNEPASELYVQRKQEACEKTQIDSHLFRFNAQINEADLLQQIAVLNQADNIDGILVQLPLPEQINVTKVLNAIDPEKDVDGFHPYNLGLLLQKRPNLRSCTPKGVMHLLQTIEYPCKGCNAVVVGASNTVGRPMVAELLMADATVTVCHRSTKNLIEHIQQADLLIVGIGQAEFVKGEWIKPGAVVIDIGINRKNGAVVGDVEFEAAKANASWMTPVPGGVGPMTVACLLENTVQIYCANISKK